LKLVLFTLELGVIQTGEVVSNDHNSPSTNPATKFITVTECFYGSNALQGVRGGRCVTPDTICAVVAGTKLNTAILWIPLVRLVQTPLQSMVSQLLEQSILKLRLFWHRAAMFGTMTDRGLRHAWGQDVHIPC